ncbi:glycosyltransferase family 2 protein, partial [Candidatus Woesebacteria bacterium]|nr:glycosyltransferase family 2 protein [Candidatus Woesebacteria bacterium]
MTKSKVKVSVVILTWNGLKDTLLVLKDVGGLSSDGIDCETIVVDNGSSDGTQQALKGYKLPNMKFKFVETGRNLGFAGGNNIGIKRALKGGADLVLLLNNDVILKENLIVQLVKDALRDPKVGIVSPKMYFAKGFEFHKDRYKKDQKGKIIWYAGGDTDWDNVYSSHRGVDEVDRGQFEKTSDTDFANGACALIKKEVFKKVGYLDEKFFLYWEDADFSQRARLAGFRIIYTPKTHLWHKVSVATGGSGSPSNDYFLIRNRLIFGFRYARAWTKLALIRDSFRILMKGRSWQKKG